MLISGTGRTTCTGTDLAGGGACHTPPATLLTISNKERKGIIKTYRVKITERWDYKVEANSKAAAKAEAEALREFGNDNFGAKHAEAVYDLGTVVEEINGVHIGN